jgi:hypothetical protein
MALKVQTTQIDGVKGETNIWDIDATVAIDPANDKIWFTAKNKKSDADSEAVLKYGANVAGLSGITVTDGALGEFRVTSPGIDTILAPRALVYDVKVKIAAASVLQTVASGTLLLAEATNKDAT